MEKMNKILILFFVIILIVSAGCVNEEMQRQEEYEKCTSVCASVLEDDFVTMKLCVDECREKFLEEEQ